ncbi:MAG: hypothetical protein R3221_01205 [Spongiibacter sp.]|nr:hypothetical protein [Spongiibacter sp.]
MSSDQHGERPRWLDRPETVTLIVRSLWVICAALVVAEFFYHKHPYFRFDGSFAFYAIFGFAAYCFIVLSAKRLRRLIKREEGYYDE